MMKNSNMKRTGQTVTPSVLADRSKAKVVPSLFPKSSNSCPGYPSPHVAQGRARLEQVKIIKEDCLLETPIIFVGIDVCKAQLNVTMLWITQEDKLCEKNGVNVEALYLESTLA